jgi:ClpP class serine protease
LAALDYHQLPVPDSLAEFRLPVTRTALSLCPKEGTRLVGSGGKGLDMITASEDDKKPTVSAALPTKTPMFEATHAARYARQALIKTIETHCGCILICYVAGNAAPIESDDTVGFVDLLHNVNRSDDLDLLLHTGGGDMDAAEKLISMVRATVGEGRLRVIVPDFAKSAGTLMALGANRILMSDSSELGPIDPQITLADDHGNLIQHSVQSYLDAYDEHSAALIKNPNDVAARIMLNKLDPATLKLYEAARSRAQRFAEEQLQRGMKVANFTKVAGELIDTKRWLSHGKMISAQDAKQIGLEVDYLEPKSEVWQPYWRLYCLQRLAVRDREKLFESNYVSQVFEASSR